MRESLASFDVLRAIPLFAAQIDLLPTWLCKQGSLGWFVPGTGRGDQSPVA